MALSDTCWRVVLPVYRDLRGWPIAAVRRCRGGSGWRGTAIPAVSCRARECVSWTRRAALGAYPGKARVLQPSGLRLHRWNDLAVVGAAVAAFAAGFGQFGVVAALGDVAKGFGQATETGTSLVAQAGMSGTDLGIGLAVMRLASLGALPVIGLADRFGRRRMLLATVSAGLALTALAAASPTYWWFVAIFACGRPVLAATNGLAQVTRRSRPHRRTGPRRWRSSPRGTAPAPESSPSCTAWPRARSGSAACSVWRWSPWPCCRCCGAGSRSLTGSLRPGRAGAPGPGV